MSNTLAAYFRNLLPVNPTRKQLKVLRAKLRRAGVTNLNAARRNPPYAVDFASDARTDRKADAGTIVAQVAAIVAKVAA